MNVRDKLDLLALRQMVSATNDSEMVFAKQGLLDCLAKPDKYQIMSHGHGAQILAASELALGDAQLVLSRAYGSSITFAPPTVHTYVDTRSNALMVPMTFLRVDADRRHMHALGQLLRERSADVKQIDMQRHRVVIRAELTMSRSLGLHHHIWELTEGKAQILSWLLRYQPASECADMAAAKGTTRLGLGERLRA